ncbi:hypothetical protein BJF78_26275 [Pseudonocardia sp. CNS-139]|nr:hypothetical protein BJF78_26275 [Pseudonocardia sp. CNS-139]
MNPTLILALSAGLSGGLGLALVAAAFRRTRPDLVHVLAALDERTPAPLPGEGHGPRAAARVVVRAVVRRLPGRVPDEDLALLGIGRDRFLVGRAGSTLAYAAAGPALAAILALLDVGLTLVVPGGITLAGAVAGWTGATRRVEQAADQARSEMRHAIVAYLQQVSLLRAGGAGVATALTVPARLLADGWAMRRIAQELDRAERAGLMPWDGLRRLGEQTGVDELSDLSAISATAGHDGGTVIDTLLARADSLHQQLLADDHEDARRASGQMSTPGAAGRPDHPLGALPHRRRAPRPTHLRPAIQTGHPEPSWVVERLLI